MSPHPLTNFEIQKYYIKEPKFNGVYSRNNQYHMQLDVSISIWTDWIALYGNCNDIVYFNSFGVEHIPKS